MANERHDSLVREPRAMKTIEDALQSLVDECMRDKFWHDMAKPATVAMQHLRAIETATDAAAATEARATALMLLRHLNEQLQAASDAGMFKPEARMINIVAQAIENDPSLTLASPLSAVAQRAHADQAAAAAASRDNEAAMAGSQQASLSAVKAALVPFEFMQRPDDPELTVTIAVPAEAAAKDCRVLITRDSLYVSVVGHALQPIIDGKLLHAVDVSSCEWHLEGSGDGRKLVIDAEKAAAGLDWSAGLLAIGKG